MVSIDVWNASVDFPIFDARTRSLKKKVLGKVGGKIGTEARVPIIEALHDVTLTLREGDRVGLVGHNGAGKSTLLRLLAGIYEPTRGSSRISGKIAPVFDLGVGMDPEISGEENIIIRGLFLGMTAKEMEKRVDDIAEFTELGDYLKMPLRTYSTGMRVRLALGVVTSIDPEILILDEGIGASCSRTRSRSSRPRPEPSTTWSSWTTVRTSRPATSSRATRCRTPTCRRTGTSAAQAGSRSACCTRFHSVPTGCGWPMTTA